MALIPFDPRAGNARRPASAAPARSPLYALAVGLLLGLLTDDEEAPVDNLVDVVKAAGHDVLDDVPESEMVDDADPRHLAVNSHFFKCLNCGRAWAVHYGRSDDRCAECGGSAVRALAA